MQLTLNLEFTLTPPLKPFLQNNLWIDVTTEAHFIGFTQKVEISQSLKDALQALQTEDDDAYSQRIYDAIWLAYHYWRLDQQSSFSFTFDFLREDRTTETITEASLRLHAEMRQGTVLLGLAGDF